MSADRHDPAHPDRLQVGSTWDRRQNCFVDPDGVRYALMYVSRCAKPDHECGWSGVSDEPGRWLDCQWCAGPIEYGGSYYQRYVHDVRKKQQEALF